REERNQVILRVLRGFARVGNGRSHEDTKTRRREERNQVILVINIETVNFPVGQEDDTTIPVAVSDSFHRQFIRVWYRSR
ncbi:MAG: hypothetical protein ACKN9U_12355, partial [Pirellulaceae bacterium]